MRVVSDCSYGVPSAAATISPIKMFSVLEYLYLLPDGNDSGWSATYVTSCSGGGGVARDAPTASWKVALLLKSGIPLVCWSSCASVTLLHAAGCARRTSPTVLSRVSLPSATADTAAAPLNAFATLARRISSVRPNRAFVATSP